MVEYIYDAWGNHKVLYASGSEITNTAHIGFLNPFRYRSYYFDTETGLYFLKTRYYDPAIGRFINMDSIKYADPETINGLNLYAYCYNNPIKHIDSTGAIPIANNFYKTYYEQLILGFNIKWLGRVDYSITALEEQTEETGIFYSYKAIDTNSKVPSFGVGFNLWGWYGNDFSYSTDGNIHISMNGTPWINESVSFGVDGISFSFGVNIGEVSHNVTVGIGTLPLVLVSAASSAAAGGGSLVKTILKWVVGLFA